LQRYEILGKEGKENIFQNNGLFRPQNRILFYICSVNGKKQHSSQVKASQWNGWPLTATGVDPSVVEGTGCR
jgi:hypothetical protein